MTALSTWAPEDGVLGAIAPLALAAAHRTALVVDLDPNGPRYPGDASLATLIADGPTAADLAPRRKGLAVLRNGGISADEASDVVEALSAGWPHLVLRLPPRPVPDPFRRVVGVHPLARSPWFETPSRRAVYQPVGGRVEPPGPGVVLPRPRTATIDALMAGVQPRRDRWLRAWATVWEQPWG